MIRIKLLLSVLFLLVFSFCVYGGEFSFAALNVGQGLNIVVQSPEGNVLMYDCGTSDFNDTNFKENQYCFDKVTYPYLKSIGAKKIDYIIMSHPHTDHYVGMCRAFGYYSVGNFYHNGFTNKNNNYKELMNLLRQKNISTASLVANQRWTLGKDVYIKVLSPIERMNYEDPDNNSVVLKISYKNKTFLLMGDIGEQAEPLLIQRFGKELKSDVLVCGGHGTKYSTTQALLNSVRPSYAIISCGANNPYHLPHSPLTKRLDNMRVKYYRTDTKGNIIFKVSNNQLTINQGK